MKKHMLSFAIALLFLILPALSFADFYADTDGDGYTDQVYACGSPAQVCIYHPHTGRQQPTGTLIGVLSQ